MTDHPPGVIFDVDGTLVDTNYLHTLAWARAARDAGETASMAAIHRLIGMGSDQLIEELLGRASEEVANGHTSHFKRLMEEIQPLPGAKELLEEVHRRGAKVVLATSASADQLAVMLAALKLSEGVVDHHTNKDDVDHSKPAPDIFRAAMDDGGLSPERAVVVGDTMWDIQAAASCGLRVVGVLTGGSSRRDLEDAGAIAVYEDPADLLAHLDESPLAEMLPS